MSDLTTKIQNVGIHACSDQTAITYIDAVNIREMMKQACINSIRNLRPFTPNDMGVIGVDEVIKAIEGIE